MVLKKRKTLWYLTYVIISIWKIFRLKYFLLPVWLLCRSQEIKQPNSNPFLLQSPNPFLAIVPICTKFCKFVKNVVLNVEAVVQRCSIKKVFLKISQNSQENTCARVSFLIKSQTLGLRPATVLKKRLWYRCFPVNFAEFLRTPFSIEHLRWLILVKQDNSFLNFFVDNIFNVGILWVTNSSHILLHFQ